MQAVSVVSRDVMAPRGLVGMALETADHSTEEIARVRLPLLSPLLHTHHHPFATIIS